jgi:ATPase
MFEQDLARPVVVVEDMRSGEARYEMYTYGDQLVVMPIETPGAGGGRRGGGTRGVTARKQMSEQDVADALQALVAGPLDVEMPFPGRARVYVEPEDASAIIGRGGRTVKDLERELGVRIDVISDRGGSGSTSGGGRQSIVDFSTRETKNNVTLYVPSRYQGRLADVLVDGRPVGSARVTKRGAIRFAKRSRPGKAILSGMDSGADIVVEL